MNDQETKNVTKKGLDGAVCSKTETVAEHSFFENPTIQQKTGKYILV